MNNSEMVKVCPVCQSQMETGQKIAVCPSCKINYHIDCWKLVKRCITPGCDWTSDPDTLIFEPEELVQIKVTIADQAVGKTVEAHLLANVPMSRLMPVLVTKMSFLSSVQFRFQHKQSGKQLHPTDTLQSAGVRNSLGLSEL